MSELNRFSKQEFNSNGTWECPAGVTRVLIYGMGGGSGGAGGGTGLISGSFLLSNGGQGGTATSLLPYVITVVPGTSYSITIGAGGAGGGTSTGTGPWNGKPGAKGGNSIFGNSIIEWTGATMNQNSGTAVAQLSVAMGFYNQDTYNSSNSLYTYTPSGGAPGNGSGIVTGLPKLGYPGRLGIAGAVGSGGFISGGNTTGAGGGSGMGGESTGGTGGNGVLNAAGGSGGNGAANSGAGGGGGAGGANGQVGGAGGAGGSGKIIVMWVE